MSDDKVTPLPLSRARATAIVQEIVKESGRWSINVSLGPDWRSLVNRRHIAQVLGEGSVVEEHATLDEHGWWRFTMTRMCGGVQVTIEVALEHLPARPHLVVTDIEGEQVSLSEHDHE